jgi:hypothetical protein
MLAPSKGSGGHIASLDSNGICTGVNLFAGPGNGAAKSLFASSTLGGARTGHLATLQRAAQPLNRASFDVITLWEPASPSALWFLHQPCPSPHYGEIQGCFCLGFACCGSGCVTSTIAPHRGGPFQDSRMESSIHGLIDSNCSEHGAREALRAAFDQSLPSTVKLMLLSIAKK